MNTNTTDWTYSLNEFINMATDWKSPTTTHEDGSYDFDGMLELKQLVDFYVCIPNNKK